MKIKISDQYVVFVINNGGNIVNFFATSKIDKIMTPFFLIKIKPFLSKINTI